MKNFSTHKVLIFILVVFCIVFIGFEFDNVADMYIYLSAASNLFSINNLYNELYGIPAEFLYMGNPFITLWFYPLSQLPHQLVAIIWKLLSIAALYRIWKIIESYFEEIKLEIRSKNIWLISTFTASLFVIYANLHLVQLTILMFYTALEGLHQISRRNNTGIGSILLSIAIATKISPIVFIPYLIYRKYWKASILILCLCASYIIIPALFVGWGKNIELWTAWWNNIDPQTTIFDMNNRKNHGISALLSTLFIENIQDNVENLNHRRHIIGLSENTVIYLIYGVRIFFAVFTLYFLRTKPFYKIGNRYHEFWELSYLFLVIPLIFPQQRTYNFLFLIPAIAYLNFLFINYKRKISHYKLKLSLFSLSLIVLNLELLLGQYRKFYWHHKSITYSAIMILILLLLIKPFKIIENKKAV